MASSTKQQTSPMEPFLPTNFLTKAPKHVVRTEIKWKDTPLPENEGLYAVVLDGLLTQQECQQLTAAAVASNKAATGKEWERAMISTGRYKQELAPDVRNSGRVIVDDHVIAARLWARVAPHVPEIAEIRNNYHVAGLMATLRGEIWQVPCLNERLRFLQYGPGEYFQPHFDSNFVRPHGSETSFYTLHLYLNEANEDNQLEGGATTFHSADMRRVLDVKPKIGRVLLFSQRNLWHSGQEVTSGLKLTMRTDIMYRKSDKLVPSAERPRFGNKPM